MPHGGSQNGPPNASAGQGTSTGPTIEEMD